MDIEQTIYQRQKIKVRQQKIVTLIIEVVVYHFIKNDFPVSKYSLVTPESSLMYINNQTSCTMEQSDFIQV